MIKQTYEIDLITPCFCGGAEPEKQAEIRSSSIRGQLRWWFRVLGGFRSLALQNLTLREQENFIFGTVSGTTPSAGQLSIRTTGLAPSKRIVDDSAMEANPGSDRGYLLFPLRPEKKGKPDERRRDRGVFMESSQGLPSFTLQLIWRGDHTMAAELHALVAVLGHLGALGFRSRRAMGSLALCSPKLSISEALRYFSSPEHVIIKTLPAANPTAAISELARWLQSWRSHGRTGMNSSEQKNPGFKFAKRDHDANRHNDPGYRAALGLPLLAKYGNWDHSFDQRTGKSSGRFASPVLLRPHRRINNSYCALVLFIDNMKWENGKTAFFEKRPRALSTDLYELMKFDAKLSAY